MPPTESTKRESPPRSAGVARRAVLYAALWLAWIWGLALASERIVPWYKGSPGWSYDLERRVTPLARWDSGWYLGIAESGYMEKPSWPAESTNHAFFPLYPALMRFVTRTTGLETTAAGTLISAAAFLGAIALFAIWIAKRFGQERVVPTVLALLAFPTSFFFASVYTESLFFLLAAAAFLAAERDRPLAGAVAGFFAGLTRITCVTLPPYLFLRTLAARREEGKPLGAAVQRAFVMALAPLLGFALFCGYFQWKFGDPLLFIRAQHSWAQEDKTIFMGPKLILRDIGRDIESGRLFRSSPARTLEGAFLLLFLFLALGLLKERRPLESLYVLMTIGLVVLTGTLESSGRYILPAFPAFAVIGRLAERPLAFRAFLAASFLVQAAYVFAFVHWVWAG